MKTVEIKPLNDNQRVLVNKLKETIKELSNADVVITYNFACCCLEAINVETLDKYYSLDPTCENLETYGVKDPENYADITSDWNYKLEYVCDISDDPSKDFVIFAKSK